MRIVLVLLPGVIHRMTLLDQKSHRESFQKAGQVMKLSITARAYSRGDFR